MGSGKYPGPSGIADRCPLPCPVLHERPVVYQEKGEAEGQMESEPRSSAMPLLFHAVLTQVQLAFGWKKDGWIEREMDGKDL